MSNFSMTEDLASKGKRVLVSLLNSSYDYGTLPKSVFFNCLMLSSYQCCFLVLKYGVYGNMNVLREFSIIYVNDS